MQVRRPITVTVELPGGGDNNWQLADEAAAMRTKAIRARDEEYLGYAIF